MTIYLRCPKCSTRITIFTGDERTAAAHHCPAVVSKNDWVQFEQEEQDESA